MLGYAATESFFKTLKVERTHLLRYDTHALAKLDIADWKKASIMTGTCIRRSAKRHPSILNPASWLRKVVYVESRQGQCDTRA